MLGWPSAAGVRSGVTGRPARDVAPRLQVVLRARGVERGDPASGTDRLAAAFAGAVREGRRAALMPYLMGGYPTLADSVRIGEACVAGGADVLELGVPYSDPLADGPVIHAAATAALAAGASLAGVLEVARALAPAVPVVLMCYANMVLAPGGGGVRGAPRAHGGVWADRARPAL